MTKQITFSMVSAVLVVTGGLDLGCTAEDKPGPRRAGDGTRLSEEQRSNLKRYHGLCRLALRLLEQKRFGAAQDKVSRALLLAGQIHGPTHPLGAQTIALRGRIYTAMERHDLAADSFRAELRIWRRALYPGDNVVVADCLHRIGVSLHRAGRAAEARGSLVKAVAMKRATLDHGPRRLGKHYQDRTRPPREPSLAASLHALAWVQWKLKAQAKALALFREAIALRRNQPAQPDLVQSLADLAGCHEALGRFNLAEKQFKEARRLAAAGALHNKTVFLAELDSRLGILYARTKRAALAESLLRKALAVFRKDEKANADAVVRCLIHLAKLQRTGKHLGPATQTIRQALNVVRKHQGHHTYAYAWALAELGEVYAARQAREQAARILGRAFEIVHKLYGTTNPRTRRLRARLVELYTALGWKNKLRDLPK